MSKRRKEKKRKKLLKQQARAAAQPPSIDGQTLHQAAGAGTLQVIARHLELGADPNQLDQYGHTPLQVAVLMSQRQAVGALLRAGASTDRCDGDGRDTVMNAARQPDAMILKQLLDHGADPARLSPFGEMAMTFAKPLLKHEHVELLREAGAPDPPGRGAFEEVAQVRSEALEADLGQGGVRVARLTARAADIPSGPSLINAFMYSIGLATIANRWRASDRRSLEYMLTLDLIRGMVTTRTDKQAAALADRFEDLFGPDEDVKFFTTLKNLGDGCHSYTPVSRATFNVATVGVTAQRMGIIWVEQEE